jgi:hypothetical protein
MTKFNIGDSVELIYTQGIHELEINKSYIIVDIEYNDGKQFIALENTGVITNYSYPYPNKLEYHFYNSNRFRKDIKIVRKKKLQKIYEGTILETTICNSNATR